MVSTEFKITIRPKKVVLFPEMARVEIFLSPTRPHESNVYLSKNTHTQTKQFPLANLFLRICVFSLQTIKDRALCFSTKKSAVRVVFKCKLYSKYSIKLIFFFFLRPPGWRFFSSPAFPETRGITFFGLSNDYHNAHDA